MRTIYIILIIVIIFTIIFYLRQTYHFGNSNIIEKYVGNFAVGTILKRYDFVLLDNGLYKYIGTADSIIIDKNTNLPLSSNTDSTWDMDAKPDPTDDIVWLLYGGIYYSNLSGWNNNNSYNWKDPVIAIDNGIYINKNFGNINNDPTSSDPTKSNTWLLLGYLKYYNRSWKKDEKYDLFEVVKNGDGFTYICISIRDSGTEKYNPINSMTSSYPCWKQFVSETSLGQFFPSSLSPSSVYVAGSIGGAGTTKSLT